MSDSRQYELVYVVSPEVTEDGVAELHGRIEEIVEQLGGHIEKTDNWGRRRLSYEIGRHREGTYVLELVNGPGTMLAELGRRLRVMDQLLRHLVVRVDEDLRKAERARGRRKPRQGNRVTENDAVPSSTSNVRSIIPRADSVASAVVETGSKGDGASTAEVKE